MKFLFYGVIVLVFSIVASWAGMTNTGSGSSGSRGSGWTSHTGGGSWGGSGGHK
jgi:hypothetical protein